MKKDFYDTLEIADNAPTEMVARAFRVKCGALDADEKLSESDKQARLAVLQDAHDTLSDPTRRSTYDEMLSQRAGAAGKIGRTILGALVVVAVAAGIAVFLANENRKREEAQAENDRAAQEEAQQQRKAAEAAEKRRVALEQDRADRARAEQERLENERAEHEKLLATRKFVVDNSAEREAREAQERNQEEANKRRAAAELERQKRYLRERGVR